MSVHNRREPASFYFKSTGPPLAIDIQDRRIAKSFIDAVARVLERKRRGRSVKKAAREGEVGRLSDEIRDLVGPTERRTTGEQHCCERHYME